MLAGRGCVQGEHEDVGGAPQPTVRCSATSYARFSCSLLCLQGFCFSPFKNKVKTMQNPAHICAITLKMLVSFGPFVFFISFFEINFYSEEY